MFPCFQKALTTCTALFSAHCRTTYVAIRRLAPHQRTRLTRPVLLTRETRCGGLNNTGGDAYPYSRAGSTDASACTQTSSKLNMANPWTLRSVQEWWRRKCIRREPDSSHAGATCKIPHPCQDTMLGSAFPCRAP